MSRVLVRSLFPLTGLALVLFLPWMGSQAAEPLSPAINQDHAQPLGSIRRVGGATAETDRFRAEIRDGVLGEFLQ